MKHIIFASAVVALHMVGYSTGFSAPLKNHSAPHATLSSFSIQSTPQQAAQLQQSEQDYRDGLEAMQAKNYAAAETHFQDALTNSLDGKSYFGMAEALAAQGRSKEALQAYWQLFHPGPRASWGGSYFPQAELEYAVLLSQNGRWAEAVAMYEKALPDVSAHGMSKINVHFDPAVPQPTELQAAAHVGIGLEAFWAGIGFDASGSERAFQEFTKAMQLKPNWPAANYYYGYGWQNLSLSERAKLAAKPGQREAVKAALEKAAKLGTPDVATEAKAQLQQLR